MYILAMSLDNLRKYYLIFVWKGHGYEYDAKNDITLISSFDLISQNGGLIRYIIRKKFLNLHVLKMSLSHYFGLTNM